MHRHNGEKKKKETKEIRCFSFFFPVFVLFLSLSSQNRMQLHQGEKKKKRTRYGHPTFSFFLSFFRCHFFLAFAVAAEAERKKNHRTSRSVEKFIEAQTRRIVVDIVVVLGFFSTLFIRIQFLSFSLFLCFSFFLCHLY